MLKTIRANIILLIVLMLFVSLCGLGLFTYKYYRDETELTTKYYVALTELEAKKIDVEILRTEKNARDLALMGELYYKFEKDRNVAIETMREVFENYPKSLGGGIWFKPHLMFPNERLSCIYTFRNKNNQIVVDKAYETEEYNYLNQNWYKEIAPNITRDDNVEWSLPYYEKEGGGTRIITAGAGIFDQNKNIIGISTVDWAIDNVIKSLETLDNVPKGSFTLFANPKKDYIIATTDPYLNGKDLTGKSLKNIPWYSNNLKEIRYLPLYHNVIYVPFEKKLENDMELVVCIPMLELYKDVLKTVSLLASLMILICSLLGCLLYNGLKNHLLKPIDKLIYIANKISKGENDIEIKIEKPEEFAKLASTFDKMTKDIKTITKEREKINSELAIAKSIQMSSLPAIFPPFPDKEEFDIYASMVAAKEVGGDFYDFYFIDDNHFMFLIADVSGKGIPAALFMMTAKTIINNVSQTVQNPKILIQEINKKICSNNKHGLFITMFVGIIDVTSGKMYCINCGHNPPLIRRNGGNFEYLDIDSNYILGVIEDAEFSIYETQLNPGDVVYTYTDGVTEALNSNEEMFGEERLLYSVNSLKDKGIQDITKYVNSEVKTFSGDVPQSDDITMLIFKYNGVRSDNDNIMTFKDLASKENYQNFYPWIQTVCKKWGFSENTINAIEMCAEEIYANIEFYAYNGEAGEFEFAIKNNSDSVELKFTDSGKEYNPLEKPDPDITLPPEERPLGGLGIFMVKQMSDSISYHRIDDKNILMFTILKT